MMVHTTTAVAFAVLALGASSLARPVEYHDEVAARDFDSYEVEARDFDNELDARGEWELDIDGRNYAYDLEERDLFEYLAERELFSDGLEERDYYNVEEYFERQTATPTLPTTSSTLSPTSTANAMAAASMTPGHRATQTTPDIAVATTTSTTTSTTVTITTTVNPKCKKLNFFQRLAAKVKAKGAARRKARESRRHARKQKADARKRAAAAKKGGITESTSSSGTSATPSPTAPSTTSPSVAATITPVPSGATVKNSTTVGSDKVTTVHRTITLKPTPCPGKKSKRAYEIMDELD